MTTTTNPTHVAPADPLEAARREVNAAGHRVARLCVIAAFTKLREAFPDAAEMLVEKDTDEHGNTEIQPLAVFAPDSQPLWLHNDCDGHPVFYNETVDLTWDFDDAVKSDIQAMLCEAYDQPGERVFHPVSEVDATYVYRAERRNLLHLQHPDDAESASSDGEREAADEPGGLEALNYTATFLPADPVERALPCVEIGGVQVYVYFHDGALAISGDFGTARDEVLVDGQVRVVVDMGDVEPMWLPNGTSRAYAGDGSTPDPVEVTAFADRIMQMLRDDAADGVIPYAVDNFGDLHSFTDANVYLENAGQQYDPADPVSLAEIIAIQDEITRRLQAGELTGGGWSELQWRTTVHHRITIPDVVARKALRLAPDDSITEGWPHADPDEQLLAGLEGKQHHTSVYDRSVLVVERSGDRLLTADEASAVGLDPTLRDGHPGSSYSWTSLTDDQRATLRRSGATLISAASTDAGERQTPPPAPQ